MHYDRNTLAPRIGRLEQLASIRRLTLDDGKARGMRVVEVDNGTGLRFDIYPDRGLDICRASFKGTPLAWLSCCGDTSPQFYEHGGIEWLRTWSGGLLTGCGLSNVGGPETTNGESHGLHGRLSHIPAEELNTTAHWSDPQTYTLEVSGTLRHSRVFGENLTLKRRISTAMGDNTIYISDTITNHGFKPAPLMLLYHLNFGWPLISEHTTIKTAPHTVTPQNDHSAQGIDEWHRCTLPQPNFREQVYYHDIPTDDTGYATAEIQNPELGIALQLRYRTAELPHLIQWKMMGEGEYVLGLEPANCHPEGQAANAAKGLLQHLAPHTTLTTKLTLTPRTLPPTK